MRRFAVMLTAALVLAFAAPAVAQESGGTVTVFHGVPGLTVDVYVNGDLTLEGFEPGTITDPLSLPAGDYEIEIYPAGADPEAEDPAISGSASVTDGLNATVTANLDAEGTPALNVFVNDVSEIPAGQARLTVRHTAAAPAVDVRANGEVVAPDLTNPDEAGPLTVDAGTITADVVLAGTEDVAIGPADLTLDAGTAYFVYAWGSADEGDLDLAIQTVGGLGAPAEDGGAAAPTPSAVPSGTGGLAEDGTAFPVWVALVAGGALVLVAGGSVALVRTKRSSH